MKKSFKPLTLSLTLAAAMITSVTAYAEPTMSLENTSFIQSQKFTTFSAPQKMSPAELADVESRVIKVTPSINKKSSTFDANAVQLYYVFYDLFPGHFIVSNGSVTLSSQSNVSLTLVQWANDDSNANVTIRYQLVSSSNNSAVLEVDGVRKGTNETITFDNVPAGTYNVKIMNTIDSNDAQGNGYIE
ncbi:hypothetical protein [Paenibacillus sp. GCM10012303]|jgi:hypothetical protein|uniref:hypothetical protein n=1 Tax=Paenibacillus sp. GCM10012303 TaxID=3317340 RepID=UPI0036181937